MRNPSCEHGSLSGLGLYESAPGLFATEQMAALAEERDTAWLRRLDLAAHPVNPRQPDLAVVERRLRVPSDALELMPRYIDEVATFLRSASG